MPIFPPPPPPPRFDPFSKPGKVYMSPMLPGKRRAPEKPFNLATVGLKPKPETPEITEVTTPVEITTKTATTSIFTDTFFLASPDYEVEALLSLKSLTGNEILSVAHRENFYTTSAVLNKNVLDIVDSINFYSPTQIIKLQNPDLSYFQNNVGAYRLSLTSSIVTINIPSAGIDQSFKIEVETFAPNSIKNDTIY
jgi:hypothetical protein